jgi:hypothetical protein
MPDSDSVDYYELLPTSISLDRLLKWLKLDASRLAMELNGKPDGRGQLWFVGGGTT